MENTQTFEELISELITKDPELVRAIKGKISDALSQINLTDIITNQMAETIEVVFENDVVYTLMENSIKQEMKKAISSYFKPK